MRHVELSIDLASNPISGSVAVAGLQPRPFRGWIELAEAIEAVRQDARPPASLRDLGA